LKAKIKIMAVSKVDYGRWHTLEGTIAEVVGALRDECVPAHKVVYFGRGTVDTEFLAVYHK